MSSDDRSAEDLVHLMIEQITDCSSDADILCGLITCRKIQQCICRNIPLKDSSRPAERLDVSSYKTYFIPGFAPVCSSEREFVLRSIRQQNISKLLFFHIEVVPRPRTVKVEIVGDVINDPEFRTALIDFARVGVRVNNLWLSI